MPGTTKPCEYCGTSLTRTGKQQSQRKYWTCGRVCANRLRIKLGNTPGWAANPYRGQRETRSCVECGAAVTRYLNAKNVVQQWTCSYVCMGKQQTSRILADGRMAGGKKPRRGDSVPCEVCGTEFYRQPAYIKQGRKYCSRACNARGQSKSTVRPCAWCGKDMLRPPSQAAIQFCSYKCQALSKIKRPTDRMHNDRPVIQNFHGYLTVYEPTHPSANKRNGRVLEHRLVMERHLGRYLTTVEQVDHINGIKTDNRIENLQLLSPTAHTIKTNGDRKRRELSMADTLAEYERRFGPLE